MLNLTEDFYKSISHLGYSKKVNDKTWDLECIEDKPYYISSGRRDINLLKYESLNTLSFFCESNIDCAAFLIFFDANGIKLSSVSCLNFRKISFLIPENCMYFEAAIRLKNNKNICLHEFIVGTESEIDSYICDVFSFDSKKIELTNNNETLVFIETLFCDVEKNEKILDRYFSYLVMQIKMFLKWNFICQVKWVVNISSDKIGYIKRLNELASGSDSLVVNVYKHLDSYEVGKKIDLNVKPNLFGDRYDSIFNKFIDNSHIDCSNKFIVRVGLDDDDFISEDHILKLLLAVNKYKKNALTEEIYIGFLDVNIVYHSIDGSSKVDSVVMSKCMTGNRFSVSYSSIPKSPFSITEDFLEKIKNGVPNYYLFDSTYPTFYYNRHGINLSKNNKGIYYVELLKTSNFLSEKDLIEYVFR